MAQPGSFNPTPVMQALLTVYVNGVERKADQVDWGGDTTGGLPEQVVGTGTGMMARTGTIRWAERGVATTSPHPVRRVDGWPPREGDKLVIDASFKGVTWRRFTGRLGRTTGSLTDGSLSSSFTDTIGDSLSTPVTIPPRLTGLHGQSYRVAWEALERSGLGLLPQPNADTCVHAVHQGDTIATIGGDVTTTGALMRTDPYGLDLWSAIETAADFGVGPDGRAALAIARSTTDPANEAWVRLNFADGDSATLALLGSALTLSWNDVVVATSTYVGEGVPVLAFVVSFGFIRVYTSPTSATTFEVAGASPSRVESVKGQRTAAYTCRYVVGGGPGGDPVVAQTPAYPTAMRRTQLTSGKMAATRGFENVTARSVVDAWGDASLSSVWMDEHGRPKIVARDRLLAQPVSRTIRVNERVFAGSWSLGDDGVHRGVAVAGEQVAIQGTEWNDYRTNIFQDPSVRGFGAAETVERFVEAAPEEDWGPIDKTFAQAGGATTGNELRGSWSGGVVVTPLAPEGAWYHLTNQTYSLTMETLGQRTLKLTEVVGPPAAGTTFYPRFASAGTGTDTHPPLRGMALPLIRAMWRTTWARFTKTSVRGPAYAPMLEHSTGWWYTPADAQRIANALAAEVAQPIPTLTGVSMLWDPTRQIGDVEEWIGVDHAGEDAWVARVLVNGYDEAWADNVPTQSVSVRAISFVDAVDGKSYADLAATYASYNQMDDYSATYANVENALPDRYLGA